MVWLPEKMAGNVMGKGRLHYDGSDGKAAVMKSVLWMCFLGYYMVFSWGVRFVYASETVYANSIGMEFVLISAGTFLMGSDDGDAEARNDEKPRRQITISKPFYLSKYEVTQEQWERLMGSNPYSLARTYGSRWDSLLEKPGRFKGPKNPATVSWDDAQAFIAKLNEREGRERYRLPTEAEWEYAARAGSTTRYSFGDDAGMLGRYAWHGEDFENGSTHPVGGKASNAWGLHDMYGNVWEWVWDWYDARYYANSPATDPAGPQSGDKRVVRGGSRHETADDWRSAFRRAYPPDYRGISIGFRPVLILEQD